MVKWFHWSVPKFTALSTKILFTVYSKIDSKILDLDNTIKIYTTHNEGKSVTAEKFNRNLKHKIYKYTWLIYHKCVYP